MPNPFYHSIIRKYITIFGKMFDDIYITRTDSNNVVTNLIKVPITYAKKDKMLARIQQDPNIDKQAAINLPIMAFEMIGFQYDASRKLLSSNAITARDPTNNDSLLKQFAATPYNFGFRLYIYVKNSEDGAKIIEQIMPFFNPDYTIQADLIPEMKRIVDIPIILNNTDLSDNYDGNFINRRAIVWTLDFTLKGNFYGPVKSATIIKFVHVPIYIANTVNINDSVGKANTIANIVVTPGLTANGTPTSNAALTISPYNITADSAYGFITNITETE